MQRINRSNRKFNRSHRRRYQDCDDEEVNIDWAKPLNQIAHDILQHFVRVDLLPKHQLLSYLNLLTKYCVKRNKERTAGSLFTSAEPGSKDGSVHHLHQSSYIGAPSTPPPTDDAGETEEQQREEPEAYTDFEVLACLRPCLLYEANEIRAAALRAIRYYVQTKRALHSLLELNLHHLIARSLDILLDNRTERSQALRLIRHMLIIDPAAFPLGLARCLAAIAGDNSLEKDQLLRVVWATMAELVIVNPVVSAHSGCVSVLTRCIMNSATFTTSNTAPIGEICMGNLAMNMVEGGGGNNGAGGTSNCFCTSAMVTSLNLSINNVVISEAVLSALLHLYNWPDTRRLLQPKGADLYYFISPFTDAYAFLHASNAARNVHLLNAFQVDVQFEPFEGVDGQQLNGDNHVEGAKNGNGNRKNREKEREKEQQQQQAHQQLHVNFEYRTIRYLACKNALLSILRSWPGMFYMCRVLVSKRNSRARVAFSEDDNEGLWDYSEIYRQTGEQNIRSLLDSLRFFGIPEEVTPTKVTQMVSGIGRAMGRTNQRSSSYFTTTSFGSKNPLESLIAIFHLPYPEVHRHLLELVFELFGFRPPDWLEDFDEALRCVYFSYVNKRVKPSKMGHHRHHHHNQQQLFTSFEGANVSAGISAANASNTTGSASTTSSASSSSTAPQVRSYYPEEWQLYEDFIACEAEAILPSRCGNRLNYITNYYALLLQCLVEFGLLEALVSVILDSTETPAVNLATILLGELLHLTGKYLPASAYAHRCQSLPSLVAASISDCKSRRHRALTAINHLNEISELKKRDPKPASLYLQQQLHFCQKPKPPSKVATLPVRKISVSSVKSNDESIVSLIKSTGVLKTKKDFKDWNWDVIVDILKHPGEGLRKLEDKDHHRLFIRRLVDFFKPSRKQFSLVSKNSSLMPSDLTGPAPSSFTTTITTTATSTSHHHHHHHHQQTTVQPPQRSEPIYMENPRLLCIAASALIDFLLDADEVRSAEFIEEFLLDLDLSFKNVTSKSPSSDEALLPSRLTSTIAHHYFLLVGRFTHSPVGRAWLDRTHIYQYLLDLISLASSSDLYIKLIVSSLDYSHEQANSMCRTLLSKVLTATPESSRIYATRFLRVLLRAKATHFSSWAIDALVGQLYDPCSAVSSLALDILDEACHGDEQCLEKVISHRPTIFHLGDTGVTFFTRFAAHPIGLCYLKESNLLESELSRWHTVFNGRYVRLVEDSLNECFSVHQRSEYGTFGRRAEKRSFPNVKHVSTTAYLPPHLYGQLVQTEEGCVVLRDHQIVTEQVQLLAEHIEELLVTGGSESDKHDGNCNGVNDENNNNNSRCRHHVKPNEATVLRVKATLWALGHICTSETGLAFVLDCSEPVLQWITALSRLCPVLSLRATTFYVLCLISSTRRGCQLLADFGWTAIQHSHDELFPINQMEYDNFYYNGRPRFMSAGSEGKSSTQDDKDALRTPLLLNTDGTVLSAPSTPFFHVDDVGGEGNEQPTLTRPFSQSSSRSSSSSYLSMHAHQQHQQQQQSVSSVKQSVEKSTEDNGKKPQRTFTLSSSSSSTSIYSNTSSLGNLVSPGANASVPTASYNRPRSSSDCVPTAVSSAAKQQQQLLSQKPDGQDSGILENHPNGNSKTSLSKVDEEGGGGHTSNSTNGRSSNSRSPLPPVPAPRSRKISAPCLNAPTVNVIESASRETRSDSNDSSRTANTALFSSSTSTDTGSRSTSFAEYSTTTSNSSGSHIIEIPQSTGTAAAGASPLVKSDRNVSFSPDSTTHEGHTTADHSVVQGNRSLEGAFASLRAPCRRTEPRQVPSRQLSLMANYNHHHHQHLADDPYPSPVDAHGYAQLQAIQRRRVQSLSGNMFFSGMGASVAASVSPVQQVPMEFQAGSPFEQSGVVLLRRPHSGSVKSASDTGGGETMPEILITDPNNSSSGGGSGGRQRKISHVSLPSNSPVGGGSDVDLVKRMLRIPSSNSIEQDGQSSSYQQQQPSHRLYFNRSNSRVSKGGSFNSVDSSTGTQLGGLDGLSLGGDSTTSSGNGLSGSRSEKTQFMCLCLPDCLSLIFHINEENASTPKPKRVQFSSQLEQTMTAESSTGKGGHKSNRKSSSVSAGLRSCISSQTPNTPEKTKEDGLDMHSNLKCIRCCLKLRSAEHLRREMAKSPQAFLKITEHENDHSAAAAAAAENSKVSNHNHHQRKVEGSPSSGSRTPRHSVTSTTTNSNNNVSTAAIFAQRKEVLRLVFNLSGAMYARQAEQGLLILKQRYPAIFEDFCLFSEVCLMMESIGYRSPARRFLHELFDEGYLMPQLTLETAQVLKHRLAINNAISGTGGGASGGDAGSHNNSNKQLEVPGSLPPLSSS